MKNSDSDNAQGQQFLTKKQLANLLQITERTVDRWVASGIVPPETRLTVGGCVRFRSKAIAAWIDQANDSNRVS